MYYSLSRLAALDIKWADLFDASSPNFSWNHYNPYYQLIIVAEGQVRIQTDQGRFEVQTGEALLLMPWEQHTSWPSQADQGKFFWTQFSCLPEINLFDVNKSSDTIIMHTEKTELRTTTTTGHEDLLVIPKLHLSKQRFHLLSLMEELVAVSQNPKGYFRFRQTLLLGQIFQLIANDFLDEKQQDAAFPTSYFTYRKLVSFLNNQYEHKIGKDMLEQLVDRNYDYLSQIFKKYAGITITNYVNQLRIQRAKHLLLTTDKSISTIAQEIGFEDAFYFSRIFKREAALSPQHYRDQRHGDNNAST